MPSLFELAQAGAHYGHHRSLTFPKAKSFVYMTKNNVSLINLEETLKGLEAANALLREFQAKNKPVLFVGTKRSIREIVKNVAETADAHFIVERWYGGFLTNFPNFLSQIKKIGELEEFLKSEKAARLEKKERARHQARYDHAMRFLGGVATLKSMPELIIVGSATEDKIAIGEARRMGIPVIAVTDTDVNPADIDYPIPANDDAPKAVELILQSLVAGPAVSIKAEKEATTDKPKKAAAKKPAAASKAKTTKTKK